MSRAVLSLKMINRVFQTADAGCCALTATSGLAVQILDDLNEAGSRGTVLQRSWKSEIA